MVFYIYKMQIMKICIARHIFERYPNKYNEDVYLDCY